MKQPHRMRLFCQAQGDQIGQRTDHHAEAAHVHGNRQRCRILYAIEQQDRRRHVADQLRADDAAEIQRQRLLEIDAAQRVIHRGQGGEMAQPPLRYSASGCLKSMRPSA